jgi:hypothetical protein
VDDDYVPNCQTLIGDQNGHLSILNEYLDFNKGIPPIQKRDESARPNQQTMDGNCFYEPMKNLGIFEYSQPKIYFPLQF